MAMAHTSSISKNVPIKIFEGTLDLASVGATGTAMAEVDITVTGVLATDIAVCFFCTVANFSLGIGNVRVKAANTISVVFDNTDDAAINEGELTFRFIAFGVA